MASEKVKVRRQANVDTAQQLLRAVNLLRQQKKTANLDRITQVQRRNCPPEDVARQLDYAVADGLLIRYPVLGLKYCGDDLQQEAYRQPYQGEIKGKDGHDWYCFECHEPGKVVECLHCWRVFHPACVSGYICGSDLICNFCESAQQPQSMTKAHVNQLLSYTITRLKEKTNELYNLSAITNDRELQQFVFEPLDLNLMKLKAKKDRYTHLDAVLADTKTILHNVKLVHGTDEELAELAELVIKDCVYELNEIKQCPNCYLLSNARPKDWFCQPCDPPHALVYAKVKGYPYWPAKVIQDHGSSFDVRFFDGHHQRALISAEYVKPITAQLTLKKTVALQRSFEKLRLHQHLSRQQGDCKYSAQDEDRVEWQGEAMEEEEKIKPGKRKCPVEWKEEDRPKVSSTLLIPSKSRSTDRSKEEECTLVTSTSSCGDEGVVSMATEMSSACNAVPKDHQDASSQTEDLESGVSDASTSTEGNYPGPEQRSQARMCKKFEEEKEKGLEEQSKQLQIDFEKEKKEAVRKVMSAMKQKKEEEHVRQKQLFIETVRRMAREHTEEIQQVKRKMWCSVCEMEAKYHCCWNTNYCSVECQNEHWFKRHRGECRNKQ